LKNIFNLLQPQSVRLNHVERIQEKIPTEVAMQIKVLQHRKQQGEPMETLGDATTAQGRDPLRKPPPSPPSSRDSDDKESSHTLFLCKNDA